MKIVVSDASALIVLAKLNRLEILRELFTSVVISPEVYSELTDETAKVGGAEIAILAAQWLLVQSPQVIIPYKGLHPGETAAIALAKELNADFLIIDEKQGRKIASQEHINTIGTIGVLEKAADSGLLDLASTFAQLKQIKFYVTEKFLDARLAAFEQREALQRAAGEQNSPTAPNGQEDKPA